MFPGIYIILVHLTFTVPPPGGEYYYPHFIDNVTDAQEVIWLAHVSQNTGKLAAKGQSPHLKLDLCDPKYHRNKEEEVANELWVSSEDISEGPLLQLTCEESTI